MSSPEAANQPARYRTAVTIVLIVASLAWLFGDGLLQHVRFSMDRWHLNDDVRQQIWPFLRYADAQLFRGDYIADYYLANIPPGYRVLFEMTARVVDPREFSKLLPYAELLVFVVAMVAATWSLAGPAAAWGTGALCLSTTVFLSRLAGGLPRSFGFPLIALTVLALLRGRAHSLCVLTVLGAALYYPIGITIGVITALHLLVMPRSWQGKSHDWSTRRRVLALSATATAAALLALPSLVAVRPYGPLLGYRDVTTYPESGPGGRYIEVDLPMRDAFIRTVRNEAAAALVSNAPNRNPGEQQSAAGSSSLLVPACELLLGVGFLSLLMASVRARRLLPLIAAPCVLYPVALALWPRLYLPARYITHVVPVLVVLLVPAAVASLIQRVPAMRTSILGSATVVAVAIVLVLPNLGDATVGTAGIQVTIPEWERPLYGFIAGLPTNITVAGWPGGPIENVPYLSARKILHGFEVHQSFHKSYVEEMRRRMEALIDAYFAADLAPLLRLRREFGVTHLVVNRTHYDDPQLSYFAPFNEQIATARRAAGGRFEALQQVRGAAVFEAQSLTVLDLDQISRLAGASAEISPRIK